MIGEEERGGDFLMSRVKIGRRWVKEEHLVCYCACMCIVRSTWKREGVCQIEMAQVHTVAFVSHLLSFTTPAMNTSQAFNMSHRHSQQPHQP